MLSLAAPGCRRAGDRIETSPPVSGAHRQDIPLRVMYRAAAALPCDDPVRATVGLQGQLRLMAAAAHATPDWSTLVIDGPTAVSEPRGQIWFEWTGAVSVEGADLPELPSDDSDLLPRGVDETMPCPAAALFDGAARGRI